MLIAVQLIYGVKNLYESQIIIKWIGLLNIKKKIEFVSEMSIAAERLPLPRRDGL